MIQIYAHGINIFLIFFKNNELTREETFLDKIKLKNSNYTLESPITKNEIILALRKCKNNKAPGADEITFEF